MSAWVSFRQTLLRFDASKVAPWIALRNTIGIAAPLAAGVLLGNSAAGTVTAIGALNVSFSDGSDPYVRRAGRMFTAACIASAAVFIGGVFGTSHSLGVGLAVVWAFAAGMLVALDNAAADIGLISLVTLLIFSAEPLTPSQAAYSGLLAFGGGLLQTGLSVALWPLRRDEPEKRALGAVYRALSAMTSTSVKPVESPPATIEFSDARRMLSGVGPVRSSQAERFWSLLNQAERIRISLLMIGRIRARLEREPGTSGILAVLDVNRESAARALGSIADQLLDGASSVSRGEFEPLGEPPDLSPEIQALVSDARFQLDALAGQLRAASDLAAYSTKAGRVAFEKRQWQEPWRYRVASSVAILRANLSLHSAAFRHAVRLAFCVGVGDIIGRSFGWQRSYWLPMTVAIILKPDFTTTFARGVLRLAGTAVGLAIATLLFPVLSPTALAEVAGVAVFAFILRCYGPANYGIMVLAISAMVVVLFALAGVPPADVVASRSLNTAVGGLLALAVYGAWPTWERSQVSETLAQALDAYRDYFRRVRDAFLHTDEDRALDLDAGRLKARRARTNLEASVERFRSEPGVSSDAVMLLASILASSHRFAHAVLALEAGLSRSNPIPARREFIEFANEVELRLHSLAALLRGSPVHKGDLRDLRARHHALVHAGDPLTERYALVNVESDRITNSVNTLTEQLFTWAAVAQAPSTTPTQ